jgi:hypothetical protein
VLRGPLRGREGWIAGSLEDRAGRSITKAIVHAGDAVELLETANLEPVLQLAFDLPDPQTKTPPAKPAA